MLEEERGLENMPKQEWSLKSMTEEWQDGLSIRPGEHE